MKAKPLKLVDGEFISCTPEEATHVKLRMPGLIPTRYIPVQIGGTRDGTENWNWNGDTECPTLKPSILTSGNFGLAKDIVCHTFVNDGVATFLPDCSHGMAGKIEPLLDVITLEDTPYHIEENGGRFRVMDGEKIFIHGFNAIESALHGVWVKMGRDPKKWYYLSVCGGVVEADARIDSDLLSFGLTPTV